MAWLYLIIGGIFEIGWAFGLKYAEGFTNIPVAILTVILMILSFYCFAQSLKRLPISTAYAVFTGIGSFGTALIGMLFLGDAVSVLKVIFVFVLISCIVGLKFVSSEPKRKEGA
ncbi:DMT family transporter [Longirhabdus pacifica]|uniref:DMT family transporter n=1 Tax=Longirhabdus pacifica TaxID=2305227 RepID=UPI0010093825|nr:multidrug efflux SMR transporter [Longirhabdus pacifica]